VRSYLFNVLFALVLLGSALTGRNAGRIVERPRWNGSARGEASRANIRVNSELQLQKLLNALGGIASCGTSCGCCEMHKRIAQEALEGWESPSKRL
jgi:hypothetical protein